MARLELNDAKQYQPIALNEITNPDIFVVDMINGFCKSGAMADTKIMDIVPNITKLLTNYAKNYQSLYFFVDSHKETAIEFKSFPTHCLEDSLESQVIAELQPFVNQAYVVYKNSTNGFHELESYLVHLKQGLVENIIITGCCTDICVMQFALTLKTWLNTNNLDIMIIIPMDCVDTYDSSDGYHPVKTFNAVSLQLMKQAGIMICQSIK